jgi:hypothetical protein
MRFQDIPQFTRANYNVDIPWDYIPKWERNQLELNLDPDFQRAHVWTTDKQIAYVEYILRGGISGKDIYFNHPGWFRDWKGSMDIVDGKQRWQAVKEFLGDKIPVFGCFYSQYEDRLQWYLDLNSGGVVHTNEELDKVQALLKKEL